MTSRRSDNLHALITFQGRVANVKNQPPNFKQLTPCA